MSRLSRLAGRAIHDVRRLGDLDGRTARDLLRASWELARARVRLATSSPADLIQSEKEKEPAEKPGDSDEQIRRVAFAIGAMGARVPWRSDCLVQAVAGHNWLASLGIASDLAIGVKRPSNRKLDAHAWLKVGDNVVVGGDTADYAELGPRH